MGIGERRTGRLARVGDAALAAVFAGALAFQAVAVAATWGGGSWWFDAVAGAVVCAVALVRRRGRGVAAAVGMAVAAVAVAIAWWAGLPSEPGLAMALALAVLTASAVRALPVGAACAVAAGGGAVAAGSVAANLESSAAVGVFNAVAWLGGVAAGAGSRSLAARRRAAAERVRRDERMALAREMHDVVAHHITGIVLEAQAGRLDAREQPGDGKAGRSFADIEAAGSEALAAMRRVVGLMRDTDGAPPAGPSSAPESIGALAERFAERVGPAVDVRLPEEERSWPPEVAGTVHRVVQEALTNIARHATGADSVAIVAVQDNEGITVEVTDNGASPGRQRGGYGLIGMRERVDALGGSLDAGPRTGGGWAVRARLPLDARR